MERKSAPWWGGLLIVVATILAYATSFSGSFQFDDIPAILDNPSVRSLHPWWGPLVPLPGALTVSGRPALNFSFALNYAISGPDPWSYHALNLLIHLGAALALFGIVRRTLKRRGMARAEGLALAVALLWAVHPLLTESVTYIVQRAESLMGLFYLLTLYCFIRATADASSEPGASGAGSSGWLTLSVALCFLGVATKEVMASAPLAILLYDRTFVAGSWGRAWQRRKFYYLLLAASWVFLLWLVARTGWDRGGTSGFHVGVSWVGYWITQGEAIFRYLGLAFWPAPLVIDYGPLSGNPVREWTLSLLVLGGFGVCAWASLRGKPAAFPAAVFFMVLAPTSLMPGVLQFASEHRMYLPLASVIVYGVLGYGMVVARFPGAGHPAIRLRLLGMALIALGLATAGRNRVYQDDLSLWLDSVSKRPRSALAQANVGMALLNRGQPAEALGYCEESVRLDPTKPAARYNLGMVLEEKGDLARALTEYEAAASLNPKLVYAELKAGDILNRQGRPVEAEPYLNQAASLNREIPEVYSTLAVSLSRQQRWHEAQLAYEHSLQLKPAQPDVEFDFALMLGHAGLPEAAIPHLESALRLRPEFGDAKLALGLAYASADRTADALPLLQDAARLMPKSAEAHGNLATALDLAGRTPEAVGQYREALRLKPDYAEAHYNLGNVLLRQRDLSGALDEFRAAVQLKPNFAAARQMRDRLEAYRRAHP